jgi:hypothetical protein
LSTRIALIAIICLSLFSCSTATLKFSGSVEPITSPILLQYAPHVAMQVIVTEVSGSVPGAPSFTQTTRTTCEIQITKQVNGLRCISSCTEYTDGKYNQIQYSADMSPLGKYSNVEFSHDGLDPNNEESKQFMAFLKEVIENNEAFVIRNPIVSGSSIFEIRLSEFLKKLPINITSNATLNSVVKGWGMHEGRRVLVAEPNLDESFAIPVAGRTVTFRVRMSGYSLMDAKTVAMLSSRIAGTIDFTAMGKTGRMEIKMTSATTLK